MHSYSVQFLAILVCCIERLKQKEIIIAIQIIKRHQASSLYLSTIAYLVSIVHTALLAFHNPNYTVLSLAQSKP